MAIPGISKSRFTDYLECPKLGYMSCHRDRFKSLADPLDWMAMHLIGEGNRVGQMAREYFPGGRPDRPRVRPRQGARRHRARHAGRECDVPLRGGLRARGAFCAGWTYCARSRRAWWTSSRSRPPIRSSPTICPTQASNWPCSKRPVCRSRSVSLMHFDPDYVHPGGDHYDLHALFRIDDITDDARAWVSDSRARSAGGHARDSAPSRSLRGMPLRYACRDCVYYRQACALGRPGTRCSSWGATAAGCSPLWRPRASHDVRDVPDDFPGLADGHRLVLEAVRTGELALDCEGFLAWPRSWYSRLWFMDFETYMPGLPIFAGTRPWQQIPFQWSLACPGGRRHSAATPSSSRPTGPTRGGLLPRRSSLRSAASGPLSSTTRAWSPPDCASWRATYPIWRPALGHRRPHSRSAAHGPAIVLPLSTFTAAARSSRSRPVLAPHLSYEELGPQGRHAGHAGV